MKIFAVLVLLPLALFSLQGCEQSVSKVDPKSAISSSAQAPLSNEEAKNRAKISEQIDFQTVEWTELIPKEQLAALLDPPDYIVDIVDGSDADQLASQIKAVQDSKQAKDDSYQRALISTNIIEAMNGKYIRIPGFVVPVDFNDQQQVISFFLVPYFGACIHMPPPPPNQIVYVETSQPFSHESLYDAVWVSGKLTTGLFEDPTATSAYLMEMYHIEDYQQ